jgi:hypothetical protein
MRDERDDALVDDWRTRSTNTNALPYWIPPGMGLIIPPLLFYQGIWFCTQIFTNPLDSSNHITISPHHHHHLHTSHDPSLSFTLTTLITLDVMTVQTFFRNVTDRLVPFVSWDLHIQEHTLPLLQSSFESIMSKRSASSSPAKEIKRGKAAGGKI